MTMNWKFFSSLDIFKVEKCSASLYLAGPGKMKVFFKGKR